MIPFIIYGQIADITVTIITFKYTFLKKSLTGRFIIPLSIVKRIISQSTDTAIATTNIVSGGLPSLNKK